MSAIQQPELQQQTLRLYGELLCRRPSWAGQLVLAAFPGAASSGLAAAASIAGAASLTVDSDSATMKAHFRDGAYDFVVNTLDEALRALKNEIRRGRPIAIGLIASPEEVLREASERGLSALVVFIGALPPSPEEESITARNGFPLPIDSPSQLLTEWLASRQWTAAAVELQVASAELPEEDLRRRWLQHLPAHQRSASKGIRWSWLSQHT